jgi:hypothetical protein
MLALQRPPYRSGFLGSGKWDVVAVQALASTPGQLVKLASVCAYIPQTMGNVNAELHAEVHSCYS